MQSLQHEQGLYFCGKSNSGIIFFVQPCLGTQHNWESSLFFLVMSYITLVDKTDRITVVGSGRDLNFIPACRSDQRDVACSYPAYGHDTWDWHKLLLPFFLNLSPSSPATSSFYSPRTLSFKWFLPSSEAPNT